MSNFGKTEKIIFSIAAVLLLALSYFLYDDSLLFKSAGSQKNLELIGRLTMSENDVRRKNVNTLSWRPASTKDQVFQNDSIFTGDNSAAMIELDSGSNIQVQPNSLITLNIRGGQMSLDLRYGNLVGSLKEGETLHVKSGEENFTLEGNSKSKVEFKKKENGGVDLKLLQGKVKYVNKDRKQTSQLPTNTPVAVLPKGAEQKKIEESNITLLTKDNTHWLRISPQDPLPFAWKSNQPLMRYEIEFSTSNDFENLALSKTTAESTINLVEAFEPGEYFWRVKGVIDSNNAILSNTHRMSIKNLDTPKIITPTAGSRVSLTLVPKSPGQALSAATTIDWSAPEQFTEFLWQVSRDINFEKIVSEERTQKYNGTTPSLTSGDYWVRVQGRTLNQNASPWSEPVPFSMSLVAIKPKAPDRPVLVTKSIQFKPNDSDRKPAATEAPRIEWTPVLQSKNYRVQISATPTFETAQVYELDTTQTYWNDYRPGKYFYRVFAQSTDGVLSLPSDVGQMNVDLSTLNLQPIPPFKAAPKYTGPQQTQVNWSSLPYASNYVLQFSKDKDFTRPIERSYTATSASITLPKPGSYHVRVQALGKENTPVSYFSNPEEIIYQGSNYLLKPSLLEPFNNASVFTQNISSPLIWLEWKKIADAAVYKIEISNTPNFSKILISGTTKSNRYLIKDEVPLGKIYWRVRAETPVDAEISDWAEPREFTLHHQKNETFIK